MDGEVSWHLGLAYQYSGRLEDAFAEFDRVLPNDEFAEFRRAQALGTALSLRDRAEIEKRLTTLDGPVATFIAAHIDDEPAAALDEVRRLPTSTLRHAPATLAAYFGDAEYALSVFRELLPSIGADTVAYMIWSPLFADMRALPEFKELVKDMGLVEYWRVYGWPDYCSPLDDEDFRCG